MADSRSNAVVRQLPDIQPNAKAVTYMINHVFLPPKLPQADDFSPELDSLLADAVLNSLQEFSNLITGRCAMDSIISMLKNFRTVHNESGHISQTELEDVLSAMSNDESLVVALNVSAQNAGLILRRDPKDLPRVLFEVFELSPDNNSVVSTKGRLQRSFPAFTVSVPQKEFSDMGFQATLSQTVSIMSAERIGEMQPQMKKAGKNQSETFDSVIPHLVTEHLVSFLLAVGKAVETTTITKNTREEVMWKDAKSPWRRSPMWLLLRVSLQLAFSRLIEDTLESPYKPFMVFLMSRILKLALTHSCIESDVIYSMNAKLSQRLLKVEDYKEELWFGSVRNIMMEAQSLINTRWESVIASSCPTLDLSAVRELDPSEDLIHNFPQLDYLLRKFQSFSKSEKPNRFEPREKFPSFHADDLPRFAQLEITSSNESFCLAALEMWVELHLETWLNCQISPEKTCVALKGLISNYHSRAKVAYSGNPEAISLMVLTILDLWIACDKTACRLYELLKQYDHEIDPGLISSLLLPLQSQLNRVAKAELYLQSRATQIDQELVSPFRDFGHCSSFAVRYFDQSPQHQQLLTNITEEAHREKEDKIQKLAELNKSYRELIDRHESCDCEFVEITYHDLDGLPYEKTEHNPSCKKCAYLEQAKSMTISLYEWPLSEDPHQAKATIFELNVPLDFGAWRDVTFHVLQTVFGYKYKGKGAIGLDYVLKNDSGIKNFHQANTEQVGIRSRTKPNTLTHQNPVSIPTTQDEVCLANGLSYQYYDFKTGCLISAFDITSELNEQCTFVLPPCSMALQKFLERTPKEPNGLGPNEVFANQFECPDGMSLDEFRTFATLPLGYAIQWQNILGQLAVPSIDFTKVETAFLLFQISQQIGPNDNFLSMASHEILRNERFAASFLDQLRAAKRRIGQNWESFLAIAGFICLAARLLASNPFPNIQSDCVDYLASCRSLLFGWVMELREKVQKCTNDVQRTEFAARVTEVALICMSSFCIDREHLKKVLSSTADVSVFLQCSITIQEHLISTDTSRSLSMNIFLARWRQLMYKVFPELIHLIGGLLNSCLDIAVKAFWVDYKPGTAWQQLPAPNQHWFQALTSSDGESHKFTVHLNLLTAELLVNGAPLAKLPAQYENHSMYATLFGRSHIQVMPSDRHGFLFSSRCKYAGYLIHFGILGDEMLLRAVNDNCMYDLIPPRALSKYLPQAFVKDYVHWFDHHSQSVSFAPIKDPWSRNPHHWHLSRQGDGWILKKGNENLVSMQSQTARVIANILLPLEDSLSIHIFYRNGSKKVEIELPIPRLGFFFNIGNDTILSRQFQEMTIDRCQNVGTLFGLTSKLVLQSNDGSRRVLIPEGVVTYRRHSGHMSVSIERGTSRIHSYCVDNQLGRLVGSGSMQSMIFLCYLHCLTSYCLPDHLTRVTGSEQALTIITSAAVRSFDLLDKDNLRTLELVAQLIPKRFFYPKQQNGMQTVCWDPELSFLSQHGQLYLEVADIFSQAMRSKSLHPEFVDPPSLDWNSLHLLERDLLRSSTFCVSGFGAEKYTSKHDERYWQRDRGQCSDRAQRTFNVAYSVLSKEPILHNKSLLSLDGYLWKILKQQEPIPGPQTLLAQNETVYGGHLLGKTGQYLASKWCSGHFSLSCSNWENRYRLMMWLSTTAFAQEADMLLIETFVAFYCIPAMARISPPDIRTFKVRRGYNVGNIAGSIQFQPLHLCPEGSLAPLPKEPPAKTRRRRMQRHQKKQDIASTSFVRILETQWPC